ncbi:hypothetical protein Gotri_001209 [Gossypium trilobum]|uniref:Uncharacterized protein n=1 Tax=Gossypium trilobum TaxID=34281 RepID=A0A7J9FEV4_9ROSI|nr:hypothetical protein [Gossypium trilobum]
MEKGFLDKVEDNVAVRIWFEKRQQGKGDNLTKGYMSELWDFTYIKKRSTSLPLVFMGWSSSPKH